MEETTVKFYVIKKMKYSFCGEKSNKKIDSCYLVFAGSGYDMVYVCVCGKGMGGFMDACKEDLRRLQYISTIIKINGVTRIMLWEGLTKFLDVYMV